MFGSNLDHAIARIAAGLLIAAIALTEGANAKDGYRVLPKRALTPTADAQSDQLAAATRGLGPNATAVGAVEAQPAEAGKVGIPVATGQSRSLFGRVDTGL